MSTLSDIDLQIHDLLAGAEHAPFLFPSGRAAENETRTQQMRALADPHRRLEIARAFSLLSSSCKKLSTNIKHD